MREEAACGTTPSLGASDPGCPHGSRLARTRWLVLPTC